MKLHGRKLISKYDQRPPRGSWAPGEYLNVCSKCGQYFAGDKRATHCADCSYTYPDGTVCVAHDRTWWRAKTEDRILGQECSQCGSTVRLEPFVDCRVDQSKPPDTTHYLACRCLHPEDGMLN